ncbi:MAG: purine-nucleoside phosphorylase [Mangrovibacterium sp.]
MLKTIEATADYIRAIIEEKPEAGIILGSGLGGLIGDVRVLKQIPYEDIPGFPVSTVAGHNGMMIYGALGGKKVMALQGRFHYYEGYSMKEVTFPVRVMQRLGINTLFVSNAAGGLNPDYRIGDLVMLTDHINMFPEHPLHGKNEELLGPRFPDMSQAYDSEMCRLARQIAGEKGISLHEGVYVGVQGPSFETPAEYRMYRIMGGDVIGMSTVPEVIVARHMGIKVFGISVVTDIGVPGEIVEVSHEEVQEVARAAEPGMTLLVKQLIALV